MDFQTNTFFHYHDHCNFSHIFKFQELEEILVCEIMMEIETVLHNVLYSGVGYLVIIKSSNSIHFFQGIQLILLLKIPLINIFALNKIIQTLNSVLLNAALMRRGYQAILHRLSKQMFYGLKDCCAKSAVNYGQLFFM